MNKLWAAALSPMLVAQVCAVTEGGVPATFNYRDKSYRLNINSRETDSRLSRWSMRSLSLEQGCLTSFSEPVEVVDDGSIYNSIKIVGATDEDYASFEGHENEIIGAVLLAYQEHPKVLEQLRGCYMFGTKIGNTPVYGDLQHILQRNQQIQRDQQLREQFLKNTRDTCGSYCSSCRRSSEIPSSIATYGYQGKGSCSGMVAQIHKEN